MTDDNREPPAMVPSAEERAFGDPAPRSFDKERPGPGWSVSAETHRELARLEQSRRDAVARLGSQWKDPETGELKWTFPSRAIITPAELQVAEAVRRAASAPPQPSDAERLPRWTPEELDELKAELCRRHLLDPLWIRCADAIGSVQFDLVDAQAALAECRQDRDHYRAKAYELGDAEGKLQDELTAARAQGHAAGVREGIEQCLIEVGDIARRAAEQAQLKPSQMASKPTAEQWKERQWYLHGRRHAATDIDKAIRALATPEPQEEKSR